MTKKLISSLLGLGGIFGTSINSHWFSWREDVLEKLPEQQNLKTFPKSFLEQKTNYEDTSKRVTAKSRNSSSLNKYYFDHWKYQSEGATDVVHLVDSENRVKEVSPESHGRKRRRMHDGILIDGINTWFSYRTLPHQVTSESELKDTSSTLEKIKKYKESLKRISVEEMRLLGEWWTKLPDHEQCDLLEIFLECQTIKENIGRSGQQTKINDGLKIRPEKFVSTFRESSSNFPKVQELLGKEKFIDFVIRGEIGRLAGGPIDEWIEEYLTNELENLEKKGTANPLLIGKKLIAGEGNFQKCESLTSELEHFFPECKSRNIQEISEEKKREGEKILLPKIKEVVKGGVVEGYNDIRVSVRSDTNKDAEIKKWIHEEKETNSKKAGEFEREWKEKGIKNGIVDVKCEKWKIGWTSLWNLLNMGKQEGCELAWQMVFKGDVHDKRWCLFEIPEGKSYVREYQLLGLLPYFHWYKTDKFWAKCSTYGL
ncbi:hypothetical protein [Mycoplasma suis]|uniref:Uncharacterized protein n=1 Tax=Mycoplasma suis (strain Illinois) TaxID=768700 RepID=F0QRG3_MYCSL|nr:hypothetical protein [Mycoplasma suis]ADX98083.1 hypothetical protein MSU_0550 [Mycoplasma suis str. Illinois]